MVYRMEQARLFHTWGNQGNPAYPVYPDSDSFFSQHWAIHELPLRNHIFSAFIRLIRGIHVLSFIFWFCGWFFVMRARASCPYGKIRFIFSIVSIRFICLLSQHWATRRVRPYKVCSVIYGLSYGTGTPVPYIIFFSLFAYICVHSRFNIFYLLGFGFWFSSVPQGDPTGTPVHGLFCHLRFIVGNRHACSIHYVFSLFAYICVHSRFNIFCLFFSLISILIYSPNITPCLLFISFLFIIFSPK